MNATAQIEEFPYKNLKIFYKKTGSGKPIIFLHNGGNSHIIWNHHLHDEIHALMALAGAD